MEISPSVDPQVVSIPEEQDADNIAMTNKVMDRSESVVESIDSGRVQMISNENPDVVAPSPLVLDTPSSKVETPETEKPQLYAEPLSIHISESITDDCLANVVVPSVHVSFTDGIDIPSALQFRTHEDLPVITGSTQPTQPAIRSVVVDDDLSPKEKEAHKETKLMNPPNYVTIESSTLIETTSSFLSGSTTISHMSVGFGACNKRSLKTVNLSNFPVLISFTVSDCSFKHTEKFLVVNCPKLEFINIGEMCFTIYRKSSDVITGKENTEMLVENCPKLTEISIGRYSFYEYTKCTFHTVPLLHKLHFGKYSEDSCNFASCSVLELIRWNWLDLSWIELPKLKDVLFGSFSFYHCSYLIIHCMIPKLI